MARARDQAVGVAHLYHHRAEVGGVVHLLEGLGKGDTLLCAELGELLGVCLLALSGAGVDDGDAGDVDGRGIAKDDEVGKILLDDLLCGLDGTRILALGQDDGLLVGLGGRLHAVKELAHDVLLHKICFAGIALPRISRSSGRSSGLA